MKKRKLILFGVSTLALFGLVGCIFDPLSPSEDIVITPPTIELVSSMKINLRKRSEKKLNPVLSNTEVKNPVFIYSSSNTNVATAGNDGTIHAVAPGQCKIYVTLQSDTSVKTSVDLTVTNDETGEYDYTIMFYMCGSDLEYDPDAKKPTEHEFFSRDIQEILSVKNIPDSVKIVIETGGTKKWAMPSQYLEGATKISSTNLQRWEVNNVTNKLKLIETLPGNYMAKESSFEEFLSWGLDDYEADQMGVVISGHGGGIAGCAYDDNYTYTYGDNNVFPYTLKTQDVATAASAALSNSSKSKFTWIGYDCCVMQCADIASVNADYFDYMVASQELENATGWNHDVYLPYLKDDTKISPTEFLPKICDAFVADNHKNTETFETACLQTLSVLDLSKAPAFTSAFNALSNSIGTLKLSYEIVKNAFMSSYNEFGDCIFGLCDFDSLLDNLNSLYDVTAVKSALQDLVFYNVYCSKYQINPCGVNAFFPESLDNEYILQVGKEDYKGNLATKFTTWQTMCLLHGDFSW